MELTNESVVKPFLRWAGGKSWLVKHLEIPLNGLEFGSYHEPFLGGGSVFFSIISGRNSFLSDLNSDLISTYEILRDHPTRLINTLSTFRNSKSFYYRLRDTKSSSRIFNAAKFIYLNQTSYNGIYRVNLEGVYNVPYGFRQKEFLNEENLIAASNALKGVNLSCSDYKSTVTKVKKGDLVFLDPPYTVSHNHNGFIKYNQKLFSLQDQYQLAEYINAVADRKAYFILSNAAHKTISQIFAGCGKRYEVSRASLIGGLNAKRERVDEFIFTNIPSFKPLS